MAREWEKWTEENVALLERQWAEKSRASEPDEALGMLDTLLDLDPECLTLLDMGCGNGRYYPGVNERGLVYLGVDVSPAMVEAARRNHPGGQFEDGTFDADDILDSKIPADSYDVVLCCDVLIHLPDYRPALQTLARIARRWIILRVPYMTRGDEPSRQTTNGHGFIEHYINRAELLAACADLGLKMRSSTPCAHHPGGTLLLERRP